MTTPSAKAYKAREGSWAAPEPLNNFQSRRFVSFAEEDVLGSSEAFAAKFGDASSTGNFGGADPHPADQLTNTTPSWLLQDGAAASGSTEDIMDEFLTDDDMLRLEDECLKWYDLNEDDLKQLKKLNSQLANQLLDCHRDMSTFLRYRQQLNEKHARKASVKINMRRRTMLPGEETILEEEGEEVEDDLDKEEGEADDSHNARDFREAAASTATASGDNKSRGINPAKVLRKRSIVSNPRRMSVSAKLARAGTQIAGEESAPETSAASQMSARGGRRPTMVEQSSTNSSAPPEQSPSMRSRRSVFGVKPVLPADKARRMSLAAKATSDSAESPSTSTDAPAQKVLTSKKMAAPFASNQSQGSESSGGGERTRMSRSLMRKNPG